MHNFSPTSPVLGDPLQVFPAQPHLRDVCLKVMSPGVSWGFHVKACLVMLVLGFINVWPSHPRLLLRMSISIRTWFVLSQRSLLLTLSIHYIPNIFCKRWFTKVWILFSVVLFIRQVSPPYSNTDLTFVLNRRIFVVLPIILDYQTFLNMWNAALAFLILVFFVCPLYYLDIWMIRPLQIQNHRDFAY